MTPNLYIQRHSNQSERISWLFEALGIETKTIFINPLFRRRLETETGQSELPALQTEDRLYAGVEPILKWLSQHPEYPSLFPSEVVAHVTLDALLYFSDQRLCPLTQKIHYRLLLSDEKEFDECFLGHIPAVFRKAVRFLAKRYLKKQIRTNPGEYEKEDKELNFNLRFLTGFLEGRQYCFEKRLTMADITICSYLYPLLYQKRYTQDINEPLMRWVTDIYKKHRQVSIYQPLWHPAAR